ncbi:hypothetical protein [Actinacidiphila sp. ITFR-21]|uniref:hypothetical protein n=1 Tax=Actinacidiphila sp. ITFR-21 TaxID=3075199 RepID=UPI00288C1646|nr:hypothetical protein [Streptomyces sp. ITFR-21]WNI17404.1 hypothetical protein RLT57_19045 [Streptomyces sp. ITFR-21]
MYVIAYGPWLRSADIPLAAFSVATHRKHPQADVIPRALAEALKTADEAPSRFSGT